MSMSKAESKGVSLRVTPNARKEGVERDAAGGLRIRLRAPAVEGKANAALVEFLAERLGVGRSKVLIRSGLQSRNKVVEVEGWSREEVESRLLEEKQ